MSDQAAPFSALLGGDHQELDLLLEAFRSTSRPAQPRATVFREFAGRLSAHIRLEEEQLFPRFGEGDPGRQQVVERMLEEHRQILDCLRRIEERLTSPDAGTADLEEELVNVLWAHNAREETGVYPWFDEHLTRAEAERLAAALRPDDAPDHPS